MNDDEERDKWLENDFPLLHAATRFMVDRMPPHDVRQVNQLAGALAKVNDVVAWLIEKRSDLQVENQNLKDLLAAIDRRN